jgi:hypothetical protein
MGKDDDPAYMAAPARISGIFAVYFTLGRTRRESRWRSCIKFILQAAVEQQRDSGQWSNRALITRHHANEIKEKFVSASNTFPDKVEAERYSLEFAKEVVDGKYQNATIEDLL